MNELCDRLSQAFFTLTDASVGSDLVVAPDKVRLTGKNRLGQDFTRGASASIGIDRDALLVHARSCPRCRPIGLALTAKKRPPATPVTDPPARVWASIEASLRTEGLIREGLR